MKRLICIALLSIASFVSAKEYVSPWDSPSSVTQVSASAVTTTTMFSASTSIDPWSNTDLFPYNLTRTADATWPSRYPIRAIISNNSGYTIQFWFQTNTPGVSSVGVLIPTGNSYIWPSPMLWRSRIYASTTNTAAVSYGVMLWR